jgi:hypothetical protein
MQRNEENRKLKRHFTNKIENKGKVKKSGSVF